MESCTDGMVRFNERQADKRLNGRFKVEEDGNQVEVGDPNWVKYGMVPVVAVILCWIFIGEFGTKRERESGGEGRRSREAV